MKSPLRQRNSTTFSFSSVSSVVRLLLAVFLLLGGTFATAEVAIPPLATRVTDLTGTLSADQKTQLENSLAQIETAKGSQVAILLLPTTQPETIEQYGIRLADTWKVGRKGVDDGVIIIIAKDDRKMRIEVGYGLEGAIPDAIAKRIVSDIMTPQFKQGNFYGGLQAAVNATGKIINGEPLPEPKRADHAKQGLSLDGNLIPLAFMFVFVAGGILRSVLGRGAGATVGGTIAFLGAWFLVGSLIVAVVIAVITFLFTLGGNSRIGGQSSMGGFGGGGAGGFSGGGGGFGGGGSSGSW